MKRYAIRFGDGTFYVRVGKERRRGTIEQATLWTSAGYAKTSIRAAAAQTWRRLIAVGETFDVVTLVIAAGEVDHRARIEQKPHGGLRIVTA